MATLNKLTVSIPCIDCMAPGCVNGGKFAEDLPCFGLQCCSYCKDIEKARLANAYNEPKLALLWREFDSHVKEYHKGVSRSHVGNGAPSGAFAFTLTMSPSDGLTEEDMIKAVKKLMEQKSCPVRRYAWYLEYGDVETKRHPHIHGMYETESQGRIEKKHFKRAWPIWGETLNAKTAFRGGYHRPVKDDEQYARYIAKQNGIGDSKV